MIGGLTERKNVLVVLARTDEVSFKSLRNLQDVHVLMADQLNTYDVLCADDVVFTQAALDAFIAGGKPTPAHDVEIDDAETQDAETQVVDSDTDIDTETQEDAT